MFNMAMGHAVRPCKFYCACVADEYERQRPVEWLNLEDTPDDVKMKEDAQVKCTKITYEKFPEARPSQS